MLKSRAYERDDSTKTERIEIHVLCERQECTYVVRQASGVQKEKRK